MRPWWTRPFLHRGYILWLLNPRKKTCPCCNQKQPSAGWYVGGICGECDYGCHETCPCSSLTE